MPDWISLDEARQTLSLWLSAERAVASGQEYTIGSRHLKRADLSDITERIRFWRAEVARMEAGRGAGMRVLRAVPRDW